MTKLLHGSNTRRSYLKRVGIAAAALGGLSSSAAASDGDTLAGTPGSFSLYYNTGDDPSDPDEFGFSDDPFFDGENNGLFDSSGIRISPGRDTLHHDLQVFAGFVMEDGPKPYTLVNKGEGVFESRGQTVNFTARSIEEIREELQGLANSPPLATLAGGKWRAVATEQLKVDLTGEPPFDYEWAATRVDFYTRGEEPQEHSLTLIYVLWADTNEAEESDYKTKAEDTALELIKSGRLNPGGQ